MPRHKSLGREAMPIDLAKKNFEVEASAMSPAEGEKTGVACKASVESMGSLPRILFLGEAWRFAHATFGAIEKRL
jgi:hypothetical protein